MILVSIFAVAIGLLIVWIVLSLATIQIQEWVSSQLDKRARDMEDAIHEMLANPNLKAQIYDHPLIRGLTAKKRFETSRIAPWYYRYPLVRGFSQERRKLPSYIPPRQFAMTLIDIIMTADTQSSLIHQGILRIRDDLEKEKKLSQNDAIIVELNLLAELAQSAAATESGILVTRLTLDLLKTELEQFIEKIKIKYPGLILEQDIEVFIKSGLDRLLNEAEWIKKEIDRVLSHQTNIEFPTSLDRIRRGIAALSVITPSLSQTLRSLLFNVEDYVTKDETQLGLARSYIEKWFEDSMDRVNGVFKRYSQAMALIIGFILAVLLNVDSINLTLYLWREPAVREALIQNAANFEIPQEQIINPEQALQEFRYQFAGLTLPIGWTIRKTADSAFFDANCQLFPKIGESFGIPYFGSNICLSPPESTSQTNFFLKIAGLFLTALAVRMGAPLWFDLMKKVVNPRGTGLSPVEKGATK